MAMNTATWRSSMIVVVRSVPHIVSTVSGMMVPSWLRGPRGVPTRNGASRSFSRMSRSTRRFEVRTPAMRSRAQTLAVPLAVERACRNHGADRHEQRRIRHRPDRPRALRRLRQRRNPASVDGCPRRAPSPANRCETVGLAAHRRDRAAHRLGLGRPKGRPASRTAIFSCSKIALNHDFAQLGLEALALQFLAIAQPARQ